MSRRAQIELDLAPAARPGSLAWDPELRGMISEVLKRHPGSRYEVAARMSELLADDVSKHMLDAYTAESRDTHQISVVRFVALVEATGAYDLMDAVARRLGGRFMRAQEVTDAERGRLRRQIEELQARERALGKAAKP